MARIESVEINILDEENYKIQVKAKIAFEEADQKLELKHKAYLLLFDQDTLPDNFMPFVVSNYGMFFIYLGEKLISKETGDDDLITTHKWDVFKAQKNPIELKEEHTMHIDEIKRYAKDDDDTTHKHFKLELRAVIVVTNELNGQIMGFSGIKPFVVKKGFPY